MTMHNDDFNIGIAHIVLSKQTLDIVGVITMMIFIIALTLTLTLTPIIITIIFKRF